MASTFSTNLKLELIGNGDQSGTWGTTTNNNLGTLLEQAIAGVQNITISTNNYVLTNLNGITDEARNAVLVITGTPGAVRNILVPNGQTKTYVVVNNTTGGLDIGVQTWSGSGLTGTGSIATIPNGASMALYCTGSNCYAVAPYTAYTATPITFNGWASGTTLHVTSAPYSPIKVGQTVYNPGILYTTSGFPDNTTITAFGTGTGGVGTYTISNASTVGTASYTQPIVALNTLTQIATVDYVQSQTQSVYLSGAPSADTATAAAYEGYIYGDKLVILNFYIQGNPVGLGQYLNGVNVLDGTYVSAFGTGSATNSAFYGYISGTTLTVTSVAAGTVTNNQYLAGTGLLLGTKILSGSGTSWAVDQAQTLGSVSSPVLLNGYGAGSGDIGWYTVSNDAQPVTQAVPRTPIISFLSPLQLSNVLFTSNIAYLLGTLGTQSDSAVNIKGGNISGTAITSGTINGVTITNIGTNGTGAKTISTSAPSGGNDGDIWYQVT